MEDRARRGIAAAVLGVATAWAAGTAEAGLYRCVGPDGSTTFTDNPAACPSPAPHRPRGAVQSLPTPIPSRRAAAVSPSSAGGDEALEQQLERGEELWWRQRKQRKEEELRQVEERREQLDPLVAHCNRGGELFARDPDSGLKRGVSCDSVRDEATGLDSQRVALLEYLERGIHEECRRAGCLPGWLR